MTCIIGIKNKKNVLLAADSMATDFYTQSIRTDLKIFALDSILFGLAGSLRVRQAVEHTLVLPIFADSQTPDEYMFALIKNLSSAINENCAGTTKDARMYVDSSLVVGFIFPGFGPQIYAVYGDYQYERVNDDYLAIGSGGAVATGSLFSTARTSNIETRALEALEAASKYAVGVGPPFYTLKL